MSTIGRNDPCPCGSGKKYKKCHGLLETADAAYDRIRRLEGEATSQLLAFASQRYGRDSRKEAWAEYSFSEDVGPPDATDPEFDTFVRWITFNWRPEGEQTLAEVFLSQKGSKLDSDIRSVLEATISSPYSFLQTLSVEPGVRAVVRDVLRKREFEVRERSASRIMKQGYIVYARVVELDEVFFFMGCGPVVITPGYLDILIDLRASLEEEDGVDTVTSETLLAHEEDLREMYFEIEDKIRNQKVDIRNTDGDPLEFHTLKYKIPSFVEAFHALKDLEQKVTRMSDDELLQTAERDAAGNPILITLNWLRKGSKTGIGDNTTLAALTIGESSLTVEVNSERRARRIQKEISKRLEGNAALLKTEIKSQKGLLAEAEELEDEDAPGKESEHDRLLREHPELQTAVRGIMKKHMEGWLDSPVPALRGMTPRAAARDTVGRELLESLLMDLDLRNENQNDPLMLIDTAKLREDLGLR